MITNAKHDDNVIDDNMNGYERLKRWRERHRGLANLRQRQYRARKKNPEKEPIAAARVKVEELRELLAGVSASSEPEKPVIFRDDLGRVITERQWERLREMKKKAKEGGYELDEYVQ